MRIYLRIANQAIAKWCSIETEKDWKICPVCKQKLFQGPGQEIYCDEDHHLMV